MEESLLDETRTAQNVGWPLCLFLTAYYLLWYCRNVFIFEGQTNAHNFLNCGVLRLAKDYGYCWSLMRAARRAIPNVTAVHVSWRPPPHP